MDGENALIFSGSLSFVLAMFFSQTLNLRQHVKLKYTYHKQKQSEEIVIFSYLFLMLRFDHLVR